MFAKKVELSTLECSILNEIAKENLNNINPEFFGISQEEFQKRIECLKENQLIVGNYFGSNGSIKKGFSFFSILERGELYLRTGRI